MTLVGQLFNSCRDFEYRFSVAYNLKERCLVNTAVEASFAFFLCFVVFILFSFLSVNKQKKIAVVQPEKQ